MALFFISYDLRMKRDYQKLYDELKKFKAIRMLESMWCFERMNTDAEDLCNHFKRLIDKDDGLVITTVKDWETFRTLGTPDDL